MTIAADLQSLTPGNIISLFELDTRPIGGGDILRFHEGTSLNGTVAVWDGAEYQPYPIETEGFERNGSGSPVRPKMRAANVDGVLGEFTRANGGLEGAKLIRTRTFLKYMDAVNFPGGVNPFADPTQYIEKEVWYVSRKLMENRVVLEYELATGFDVGMIKLPRRQVIKNVCAWRYRSTECGYAGGPVATLMDVATTDPAEDGCGKRLKSCEMRFGNKTALPYGGFPGSVPS